MNKREFMKHLGQLNKVRYQRNREEFYSDLETKYGSDNCWPTEKKAWMLRNGEYRNYRASKKSWEFHNGPVPKGLNVCHHCDNPICVNPKHLFLGTQKDNLLDASRKGRLIEAGRKQSSFRKGKSLPPEHVAKFRATIAKKKALGLTKCPPERAEKIRQSKLKSGYRHSPETIEKIKAARARQTERNRLKRFLNETS